MQEEAEPVPEDIEVLEEAEPVPEDVEVQEEAEPVPEDAEVQEEIAPVSEETVSQMPASELEAAGDFLASEDAMVDGHDAVAVEIEHESDLEPAPELRLEMESLADLKADAAVIDEEEPVEPPEEKTNAAQQELSFSMEESLEDKLLSVIRENPKVTQKALKETLGISIATVKRMTTALHKAGVLERTGTNRSGEWHILKERE